MVIPMNGGIAASGGPKKKRIRLLYALHAGVQPQPDWPNVGFDFNPVMKQMTDALSSGCPDLELIPTTATGQEQAQSILGKDKGANIDGYIVLQMNCWNKVVQTMLGSGKPVLYADFLYAGSGGFLVYTAGFLRQGAPNFGFIASSQFGDVVKASNCFLTIDNADQFGAAVARVRIAQTQSPGNQACKPDELQLAKSCYFTGAGQWKTLSKTVPAAQSWPLSQTATSKNFSPSGIASAGIA